MRWLVVVCAAVATFAFLAAPQAQPRVPSSPNAPGPTPPPPPPPQPPQGTPGVALNEPMWVAVGGQTTGPFEPPVIMQKVARREIIAETLVYTQTIGRWVRAGDVPALQAPIRQAQAGGGGVPPPPPPSVPPTPPQGGNDEIARISAYLVGEWLVEIPGHFAGITQRTQTRYLPDNTFRGFTQTIAAGGGGVPASAITRPHNGRWSVQPIDSKRFTLSLTGSQMVGSVVLEILDQNRLRNEQDNYIAYRIGR